MMPPGTRLLAGAARWFPPETIARVFEPLVADWQREWLDAPLPRRTWIRWRGIIAFSAAACALTPRLVFLTPTPPAITRRIVARLIIFISVTSTLMSLPFLLELRTLAPGRLAALLFWLLPAGIALAFPFAMGFVVDGIRRHRSPSPAERVALLRTAIAAVVFTLVFAGWVVPASNQQFRLTVKADPLRPPARGFRELTIYQLFAEPGFAVADPGGTRANSLRREQHQRVSLLVLPLVLMWLRWRALDHPTPQLLLPAWLASIAAIVTYVLLRWNDEAIEGMLRAGPGLGAWVPLAAFAGFVWARQRLTARTPHLR